MIPMKLEEDEDGESDINPSSFSILDFVSSATGALTIPSSLPPDTTVSTSTPSFQRTSLN